LGHGNEGQPDGEGAGRRQVEAGLLHRLETLFRGQDVVAGGRELGEPGLPPSRPSRPRPLPAGQPGAGPERRDGLAGLIEDGDVDDRGLGGQRGGVAPQQHRNRKRAEPYHPASILYPV